MRLTKANIAGLTSPLQQAEMKSILAGTWPPLKPLPVFKYETVEYRATIDFDKKRGEWVCRKTSLPSNKVQELRGGLREITTALPHAEEETFAEDSEEQEQELEKDTSRRLQAIHEWRENYENARLYFELRDYLSESQRTEIDDSLRLSLTARQLQFNSKNVAYVFDVLSTAGGRFATLIEFAKRNKAKQGTAPQAQGEGAVPEAERAMDHDQLVPGIGSRELGPVLTNPPVRDQEAGERPIDADELPALSIKDVFPEQEQLSSAERMTHTASQPFDIETSEIIDADFPSLVEDPREEGHHSPALIGLGAQGRTGQPFADRIEGSPSRFPALEISAFKVAAFALLLLAVIAFTVGFTLGRGPFGIRLRGARNSMLATDARSPTLPDQPNESTSQLPTPRVASSDSAPTAESKPSAKPEVRSEHRRSIGLVARNVSPPESSKPMLSPNAVGPISNAPAPYGLSPAIVAASRLPRPSAILVTVPGEGSQPFRFPEKAIAATSSLAMTSQLSVLVSAEPGPTVAHQPARLEAGALISFVWPRYPRPGHRHGLAETIRVRATIGQLGQVLEVKFLSGSISLLPATTRAVREWRYSPTLLDKRPVEAQQDVTIEFRPPQYSSQGSTRHRSHN